MLTAHDAIDWKEKSLMTHTVVILRLIGTYDKQQRKINAENAICRENNWPRIYFCQKPINLETKKFSEKLNRQRSVFLLTVSRKLPLGSECDILLRILDVFSTYGRLINSAHYQKRWKSEPKRDYIWQTFIFLTLTHSHKSRFFMPIFLHLLYQTSRDVLMQPWK